MDNNNELLFGYEDDSVVERKEGGRFGLNENAHFTDFAIREDKNGNPYVAYTVRIGDREYYGSIFFPKYGDQLYHKGERIGTDHSEYAEQFKNRMKTAQRTLTHVLKAAGVNPKSLEEEFTTPAKTLEEYLRRSIKYLPSNYKEVPVDVFLQYGNPDPNTGIKYLRIPRSIGYGFFIVPHVDPAGQWKEVRTDKKLYYEDDNKILHPFKRSEFFLNSPHAHPSNVNNNEQPSEKKEPDDFPWDNEFDY